MRNMMQQNGDMNPQGLQMMNGQMIETILGMFRSNPKGIL